MENSCTNKQQQIIDIFEKCQSQDERYQQIIDLGKHLPKLDPALKIPENRVMGCQSLLYLHTYQEGRLLYFEAESDALISAGLAAILIKVYSGETPESILMTVPSYLEHLGITASLTPNRANGLYSIHLRMKQEALKFLTQKKA
jgi:cysteine desulfuration protein SufE